MNILFVILSIRGIFASAWQPRAKRARHDDPEPVTPQTRAVMKIGVTAGGRILERYNEDIVAEQYGSQMVEHVAALAARDARLTPSLPNRESTELGQRCGSQTLTTPEILMINRAPQSVLYLRYIDGHSLVLKYSANCLELDFENHLIRENHSRYIHPAIVDSMFSNRAFKFGLAPRIYFLSPPTTLCEEQKGNCAFKMTPTLYQKCAANPNASLRFVLMDFVPGRNLYDYKRAYYNATVPIGNALMVGEELIGMLEKLHLKAKIIHGNIHSHNIMVKESNHGRNVSLTFIDFGRATVNGPKSAVPVHRAFQASAHIRSPWEILGYTTAARDDIMRAVELIARLMFPLEYAHDVFRAAQRGGRDILRWKLGTNFFKYSKYDPLSAFPEMNENQKSDVRFHLNLIAFLVQEMTDDINTVPPYAAIRRALAAAREIVEPFA